MKSLAFLIPAIVAWAHLASAAPLVCHFDYRGGSPDKLLWQTETDIFYDLWYSPDLTVWTHVDGVVSKNSNRRFHAASR